MYRFLIFAPFLLQLRMFYQICKHHIDYSYIYDQVMLIKCLNNIIYLFDSYMWLLMWLHEIIYARHFLHGLQLCLDDTWFKACM